MTTHSARNSDPSGNSPYNACRPLTRAGRYNSRWQAAWGGLLLATAMLAGGWGPVSAHPDHPAEARAHLASALLMPAVIESQREPLDHGEPEKTAPSARTGGPSGNKSQPRKPPDSKGKQGGKVMPGTSTQPLALQSSAFAANQPVPQRYSCDGANVSPPLNISNIPSQAQSLALIVDDPDAPRGTFTHWLLWNIPPDTRSIAEGLPPTNAVQGLNDFGLIGYGGPCPPSGTHRYRFKLYALDSDLNLPQGARVKDLERAMRPHVLSESILMGTYHRH